MAAASEAEAGEAGPGESGGRRGTGAGGIGAVLGLEPALVAGQQIAPEGGQPQ